MATVEKLGWKRGDFDGQFDILQPLKNKIGVWLLINEAFNLRDFSLAKEVLDKQPYKYQGRASTAEDLEKFVNLLYEVYQDFHLRIENMVAEGDKVALHWVMTGTCQGEPVTTYGVNLITGLGTDNVSNWQGGGAPPTVTFPKPFAPKSD